MPKVIENIEEIIINAGKKELADNGFTDFNMRSVSKACKIAIGTIYNYFPSKNAIVSKIVLDDWDRYLNEMERDISEQTDLFTSLSLIFSDLVDFVLSYEEVFSLKINLYVDNEKNSKTMCVDLEILISNLFKKYHYQISDFEEQLIAEAFFYYAIRRDFSYNKLDLVIRKLVMEEK